MASISERKKVWGKSVVGKKISLKLWGGSGGAERVKDGGGVVR